MKTNIKEKLTYQHTVYACFIGDIVQAIVNNFVPLLFLTFHSSYQIPLTKITFLVTFNFLLQLIVDLLSPGIIDRIGYRASVIIAHIFSAGGLIALTLLPELFEDPFVGLLCAVLIYAVGGGLIEVLISPIVEACPTKNKETAMSLLHSFYCWGHVGVVLLSTVFFGVFGILNWKYLALFWALIPMMNILFFSKVPIIPLVAENEKSHNFKTLFRQKIFWIMMLIMVCAGASEQAASQWASAFAEAGLGVSKTVGDLSGPMLFAIMMGAARAVYGKFGERINLEKFMVWSGVCCILSYLVISLSPWPVLGLIGCGLCGMSVGILWPGAYSMASSKIKNGGTAMFALLALAGDVGCSLGPTTVGAALGILDGNLKNALLAGIIFPIFLMIAFAVYHNSKASA